MDQSTQNESVNSRMVWGMSRLSLPPPHRERAGAEDKREMVQRRGLLEKVPGMHPVKYKWGKFQRRGKTSDGPVSASADETLNPEP